MQRTPNKGPNSKQDKCSLELLVSVVQETLYVFQAIVIAFGCSLLIEAEGKSILPEDTMHFRNRDQDPSTKTGLRASPPRTSFIILKAL